MTRIALLMIVAGLCLPALAQTYRWLDPVSGKTVISDQPPPAGIKPAKVRRADTTAGELPPALREAVGRFPLTLYVSADCKEPCTLARELLRGRGLPYSEKAVATAEAAAALKQQAGTAAVPTLLVGRQALTGYEAGAWNQMLDLAGYPARPIAGYRPPPAEEAKPPVAGDAQATPAQ